MWPTGTKKRSPVIESGEDSMTGLSITDRRVSLDSLQFDATIHRLSVRRLVVGDRRRFAVTLRRHLLRRYTLLEEIVAHRVGALFRELQVPRNAPVGVGVPTDFDPHFRIREQ